MIFLKIFNRTFLYLGLFLMGCSSAEDKERKHWQKENLHGEYIYRRHDDAPFALEPANLIQSKPYPWEQQFIGSHPRITKDFFRCKGKTANPAKVVQKNQEQILLYDCGGAEKHGLPLKNNKEFIYPVLLNLLNYIQAKTGKKVVITCGHRCPDHHQYVDPAAFNHGVKCMIGAQVSFYVQGLENRPDAIVNLLMAFYKKDLRYKGTLAYEDFQRETKVEGGISTPPWYNKEIFIKLFKSGEGRDFDQCHPYPYINVQVRFDRDLNEKVTYSWEKARQYHRK
jgi:hypothetical protein